MIAVIRAFWAAMILLSAIPDARADQFDSLRLTWWTNLINNAGSASSVVSTANGYWSSMATNSSRTYLWSDLPFGSVSANIVSTFERLQAMALAWAMPGSSLQNNGSLAATVASGLDWMNANVYTTSATEYDNWFHWEDSGPQALNSTMVLLYPALTGTQITNYCNAIDRFSPGGAGATYGWMTGANTSDKVLVAVVRGALGRNAAKIAAGQTNLSTVFPYVTASDGFYTDGSFVFHGNIAYNGHYGLVLLGDIPTLVNLLHGSPWQITDPNLANVYAWVTNSFEPLVYNGNVMDMVRGRIVSWSYETESGDGGSTISAVKQIAQFAPAAVGAAFNNWANSPQIGPGQFQFPDMDRVVARRTNFCFGISMSSSRIANYESINGGNLHGWFTGDGMTYLYMGGGEGQYSSDFWPTVDPYHLAGTTVETNSHANSAGEASTTSQTWAGGAQVANLYGTAGMSLASWNTTLTGRKSWFMLDNEIVCLGAGITCSGPAEIHSTVEDRRLGIPFTNYFWVSGNRFAPKLGWTTNQMSANWCALDGVAGYYFPGGATNLEAAFVNNTGSWSQINSGDSSTALTDAYLTLFFNHGLKPVNSAYAYVILPGMNSTTVSNYALAPDIIVLTNTANVAAVKKPSLGVVAANFWTNGTWSADLITANNKSSVITLESSNRISVGLCDPTQTNNGVITVTLNRAAAGVLFADPGVTVSQLSPQIVLSVNVSGSLGKTFQATLSYSNSILPTLNGVFPNGTTPFQSTNTFAFKVSAPAGVSPTGISVKVNGATITNLVFSGSSTNWNVAYPHLQPNMLYTTVVTVTDTNGNIATSTETFDTFGGGDYFVEAEDFDYGGGHYIDPPETNAYLGLAAVTNVDTCQVNFGGNDLYRPNGMDTEVNGDVVRAPYNGTGYSDYSIGYFSPKSWANYTRHYPPGSYYAYARPAAGGGATTCTLSRVTSGWGTTHQTTNQLGTFNVPNTAWESYNYIPLLDNSSNPVVFTLTGPTNTLQLGRPATATADCNANYFMLVPVFAIQAAMSGTNFSLSYPTQSGFNYQVQYSTNLADGNWTPLNIPLPGNNARQTVGDTMPDECRYYRVVIQ